MWDGFWHPPNMRTWGNERRAAFLRVELLTLSHTHILSRALSLSRALFLCPSLPPSLSRALSLSLSRALSLSLARSLYLY